METYTFSRALHLMRYGGKKMRPTYYEHRSTFYSVRKNVALEDILCTHEKENSFSAVPCRDFQMPNSDEIMGSWVEVKDEKK
jgi:hypothetical protein